jgi:uncharacterized membrane protein
MVMGMCDMKKMSIATLVTPVMIGIGAALVLSGSKK